MTRRLKRIAPLQLGKISGILYALSTLLFVPFILLFSLLASFAPQVAEGGAAMSSGVLGLGMGLGLMVMLPIMYGVLGFIAGVIGAFLYNIVAGWVGGIEVEVE